MTSEQTGVFIKSDTVRTKREKSKTELTTEKFINRAREIHGDKYDYSKSDYKTLKTKLIIICREHGEFFQKPKEHFVGSGCKKCGYQIVAEKHLGSKQQRRLASIDGKLICNSTDQFIEGAKQVHGDKYDYSKSVYVLSKSKVVIICKEHGEFLQRAGNHLDGYGCPTCGIRTAYLSSMPKFRPSKVKVNSTEYFLARSFAVHGDKYDYSQTEYTGCMNKVKIICRIHGEFVQTASTHMLGCGCQKCGELKQVSDLTRRHRNKSC